MRLINEYANDQPESSEASEADEYNHVHRNNLTGEIELKRFKRVRKNGRLRRRNVVKTRLRRSVDRDELNRLKTEPTVL